MNDKFINFGRKKNRDIRLGDILQEENYNPDGFNEITHWMSREEYNELFISLNAVIPVLTIRHHYYHDFAEIILA